MFLMFLENRAGSRSERVQRVQSTGKTREDLADA